MQISVYHGCASYGATNTRAVCVCVCVCVRACVRVCVCRVSSRIFRAGANHSALLKIIGGGGGGTTFFSLYVQVSLIFFSMHIKQPQV